MVGSAGRSWTPFGVPCTISPTGPSGNRSERARVVSRQVGRRRLRAFLRCISKVRKIQSTAFARNHYVYSGISGANHGTGLWVFLLRSLSEDKIVCGDRLEWKATRYYKCHASCPGIFLTGRRRSADREGSQETIEASNFWTLV